MICHAAAGRNAAVTHLNRRAQSGEFRTRQSIYRHHCRRPDLFADRFDQFCRLHAGLPQHTAGKHTDWPQFRQIGEFLRSEGGAEMPRCQHFRSDTGTQSVRRNGTVSQPCQKNTALLRQKLPQFRGELLCHFLIVGTAAGNGRGLQCDVSSGRLSDRGTADIILDADLCDGKGVPTGFLCDPRQTGGGGGAFDG